MAIGRKKMRRFTVNAGIALVLGLGSALILLWLLGGSTASVAAAPARLSWSAPVDAITLGLSGARDGARIQDMVAAVADARVSPALRNLPLRFVVNAGQSDPAVRFTVGGAGHTLFFTQEEVVFGAAQEVEDEAKAGLQYLSQPGGRSVVRLRFPGANPHPTIEGLSPLPGVVNYFLGDDPSRWRANVSTYEAVAYRDLYPGVDLIYRSTEGRLKSEFLVAPGANPTAIQMVYSGVEALHLRADGALVLQTPLGEWIETAPLIYQETDGGRQEIPGGYVLRGKKQVGFQVAAYDATRHLVIDPVLAYASYLGGDSEDYGLGIAIDSAGNIYVAGYTYSSDFPISADAIQPGSGGGDYDAFVTQLISASGAYTYGHSTYLGGDGQEYVYDVAIDGAGGIYLAGWTSSSDFPTTADAVQPIHGGAEDAFVTQIISASGAYTLAYSTYLGGGGQEFCYGIAVDAAGDVYLAGQTSSSDFPTTTNALQPLLGGGYDGFVTQLVGASGSYTFAYSTYLGGDSSDYSKDIAVDSAGNTYVTGGVSSSDFPTTANAIQPGYGGGNLDAFVTFIISASGTFTYGTSTYLGGNNYDYGWGIVVDSEGRAYVTGYTDSGDFPTRDPIQTHQGGNDVFLTHIISASGVYTYDFSTYLGGSGADWGPAMAMDTAGDVYLTGRTRSSDFPVRGAIQATHADTETYDAFVTHIVNAGGAYTYGYSTYLGGSDEDWGYAIAVDGAGNAYVTGQTGSSDFPTTANAIQPGYGGGLRDAFVVKLGVMPYRLYLPLVLRAHP